MESSVCINKEMSVLDDINEENSTHLHPSESIDSTHNNIDANSDHCKGDLDITPINFKNYTT